MDVISNKNILIVEDNKFCRQILSLYLNVLNVNIYFFDNYDDTINELEINSSNYDLIIIDIIINGDLNGIDILKELKNRNVKIQIVMQSSYYYLKHECLDLGADDFIKKPLIQKEVINTVAKYLI